MPDTDLKIAIQDAIQQFEKKPLAEAANTLLETLGYRSQKRLILTPNTSDQFKEEFDPYKHLNVDKALLPEWSSVDLLLQITDEEIRGAMAGQGQLFVNQKVDNTIINSYLFFAIGLRGEQYTRTQLAAITREINKLFPMPVMVTFKHGQTLTIAIIARRLHKRDPGRDVLEKVTLIKDVAINQPHRAHVEILYDLSVERLAHVHGFTNFVELQRAWEKTLDTSELNKKFFREVANWYFWAVKNVTFPEGAGAEEETRNAISVIRLITRLIFVWFIKEKGLVPEDLFDERRLKKMLNFSDPNLSTYYKAILQNLFFATLNTDMGEYRKFRGENDKGRDQHYMVHNVYRYKHYFQDPDSALNVFAGIPFLNGGLFECLDRPDKDDPNKIVRVDGFSKRDDNLLKVPDELFFGDEHEEDLNTVYGTNNKHYKVRGLIHIFNNYKFTIEENTPIEEEIALDPELLGKVFENLLAAYNPETGTTARKQTGSFYTPREIVNYMVDESLIAYLESKLEGVENVQERLGHLLAYNDEKPQFNDSEIGCLIGTIDNIKVLDPACGSGAFPMGMLHKSVYILSKLDPFNTRWCELQRQKAIHETEEAYRIGDHEERKSRLVDIEAVFNDNTSDYGRKLYLIENCIYGVDIQPIAVQIAKLRFFISLVVDQKADRSKPNLGIRPLPNLETKFVAANTLISIEGPQIGKEIAISFGDHLMVDKRAKLLQIRNKHFRDRTLVSKRKHRDQDEQLRLEIAELLKKNGWDSTATAQLAGWDPYDQNTAADFFDPKWMFGIEGGFDVVIGNPPYVRQEQISAFKPIFQKQYTCYTGTADLYVYFFERGIQALRENGVLAYISSNKYFRSGYGEKLRGYLGKQTTIRHLIDFGDAPVFTSIAYPSIIVTQKKVVAENKVHALAWKLNDPLEEFDTIRESNSFTIRQADLTADGWRIENETVFKLLKKLRRAGKPLGEYVNGRIYRGVVTGYNEAFIVNKETRDRLIAEHPSSFDVLKPFLRGRDVKRWQVDYQNLWLTFVPWHFPLHVDHSIKGASKKAEDEFFNKYPAIYKHLLKFKKQLEGRNKDETGVRYEWYALQRWGSEYSHEFINTLIVWGNLSTKPKFAFATPPTFVSAPANFIVSDSRYLLGILNSKITEFFVAQNGAERQGGFLEYKPMYVSLLPVPSKPDHEDISTLVARILAAKRAEPSADTSALEGEIDRLVYGLYGLTEEEIAVVEGAK